MYRQMGPKKHISRGITKYFSVRYDFHARSSFNMDSRSSVHKARYVGINASFSIQKLDAFTLTNGLENCLNQVFDLNGIDTRWQKP